jgi:putative flippase GtrA
VRLQREIALFAAGGVLGLLVDSGIVQGLVAWGDWNPYAARVVSFLAAATFTWRWNRHYTFAAHSSQRAPHAEWLHWLALMAVGAMVNYGVYAWLLAAERSLHRWPALAAAGGSAVAALINFSAARGVLFRGARSTS